jgi:hypothetical protein
VFFSSFQKRVAVETEPTEINKSDVDAAKDPLQQIVDESLATNASLSILSSQIALDRNESLTSHDKIEAGTQGIASDENYASGQENAVESVVDVIVAAPSFDSTVDSSDDESFTFGLLPLKTAAASHSHPIPMTKLSEAAASTKVALAEVQPESKHVVSDEDDDTWEMVGTRGKLKGNRRNVFDRSTPVSLPKTSNAYPSQANPKDTQSSTVKALELRPSVTTKNKMSQGKTANASSLPGLRETNKVLTNLATSGPVSVPSSTSALSVADLKSTTLRDVLLGSHKTLTANKHSTKAPSVTRTKAHNVTSHEPSAWSKTPTPVKRVRGTTSADQNTAPTHQETMSITSSSHVILGVREKGVQQQERIEKGESDSAETEEAPQNADRLSCELGSKVVSIAPPLPTLLNPNIANSANSSVASSLEIPHTTTHRHHSKSLDVRDVGYHLLDVCDRLSSDMRLFMSRRSIALNSRRGERAALLGALQDVVGTIWPCQCNVVMYGSCATQLDLPSSDLDVIVRGAEQSMVPVLTDPLSPVESTHGEDFGRSGTFEEVSVDNLRPRLFKSQSMTLPPYGPQHLPLNGQRVLQLASRLEQLPWAVQVNPIPTASIPVVKVLADPSKLPKDSTHRKRITPHHVLDGHDGSAVDPHVFSHFTPQPWRGSDVMNGLLKLDITFEGPEHGGFGSTEFSSYVVNEACKEFGVEPESTPFVQVLMVLKELLAQRKLNEPYSGGLSSYALLLLLVALVRERAVIREEIERSERQRRAVASDDDLPFSCISSSEACWRPEPTLNHVNVKGPATPPVLNTPSSYSAAISSTSSWVSIAKNKRTSASDAIRVDESPNRRSTSIVSANAHENQTALPKTTGLLTGTSEHHRNSNASSKLQAHTSMPSLAIISNSAAMDGTLERFGETCSSEAYIEAHFPQSFNDVIEVLCAGETTAGKLLMHFLLYYGQHFDAQATTIDISGKHDRDYHISPYSYFSPYIRRRNASSIDPYTGMLIVDPIVIYDPLEGAENHNVARRCFAWRNIKWIFAQSYSTLTTAVEQSASPPSSPGGCVMNSDHYPNSTMDDAGVIYQKASTGSNGTIIPDNTSTLPDPTSPLLSCLLSF